MFSVWQSLGEFESGLVKTQDAVEGFHLLENSHKLLKKICLLVK